MSSRVAQRERGKDRWISGTRSQTANPSSYDQGHHDERQQPDQPLLGGHLDVGVVHAAHLTRARRPGTGKLMLDETVRQIGEKISGRAGKPPVQIGGDTRIGQALPAARSARSRLRKSGDGRKGRRRQPQQ